jgi:hypothetical protein
MKGPQFRSIFASVLGGMLGNNARPRNRCRRKNSFFFILPMTVSKISKFYCYPKATFVLM